MGALVPVIFPALDMIRSIGGILGTRVFAVTAHRRIWNGERPGAQNSSYIDDSTLLTNTEINGTTVNVLVKQVSRSEAIASGGLYTNRDLKVGPMTPPFVNGTVSGGFDDSVLDPPTAASAIEIFWNITGPGMPVGGLWFSLIGEEAMSMHFYIFLRANGRRP